MNLFEKQWTIARRSPNGTAVRYNDLIDQIPLTLQELCGDVEEFRDRIQPSTIPPAKLRATLRSWDAQ